MFVCECRYMSDNRMYVCVSVHLCIEFSVILSNFFHNWEEMWSLKEEPGIVQLWTVSCSLLWIYYLCVEMPTIAYWVTVCLVVPATTNSYKWPEEAMALPTKSGVWLSRRRECEIIGCKVLWWHTLQNLFFHSEQTEDPHATSNCVGHIWCHMSAIKSWGASHYLETDLSESAASDFCE